MRVGQVFWRRGPSPTDNEYQSGVGDSVGQNVANNSPTVVGFVWTSIVGSLITAILVYVVADPLHAGMLSLLLLLLLIAIGIPAAVAMVVSAAIGISAITSLDVLYSSITTIPYAVSASWELSVLPMFILMGLILWRSGITTTLYTAARHWLGWLPGGLAVTTNMAGAMLGAASGSTMAIAYALGRISIPEMLKERYDSRLAVGSVIMAGTVGQLIPPSILAVVYAGIALVPVGPQLLAGVIPGLVLAGLYALQIVVMVSLNPSWAPRQSKQARSVPLMVKFRTLLKVWPVPFIMAVVVIGLYLGVFTATEAGAFGAFGAIVLALSNCGLKRFPSVINRAAVGTVAALGAIMFLIIAATLLNRMLALSGIPNTLSQFFETTELSRGLFVLILVVFYLALGMFMEPISIMLLTVPLLMPSVLDAGIDPMWFGVLVVFLGEIGQITPPVGLLSYVVHRITQHPSISRYEEISLGRVFAGGLIFLPAAFGLIVIITIWPEVVTWLPNSGKAS